MKHFQILVCAFVALVALSLTACQKGAEMNLSDDSGNVVTGDSEPLSNILTREYSVQELRDFFGEVSLNESSVFGTEPDHLALTMADVNEKYPIECLRKNGYSVYKVKEGGYFYVFWVNTFDPLSEQGIKAENDSAVPYFTAYLSSLKSASDFDAIKEGVSTAADVAKIDPAFELEFILSNETVSYSLLGNGFIMEVCYRYDGNLNSRNDLIVKSMQIVSKDDCASRLAAILEMDLP